MMGNTAFFGWSWVFGLLMFAGIAVLVYVVVRVLMSASSSSTPPSAAPGPALVPSASVSARQILDERFARGELTTEQYREQVQTLGEGR